MRRVKFVTTASTCRVGDVLTGIQRLIYAQAASVQATGNLTATASNDINITAGRQTNSTDFGMTTSQSDLFSSSSTKEVRTAAQNSAAGSSFGGNNFTLTASNDINVKGSSVIGDTNVTLSAGRNIAIEAAVNTSSSTSFKETKESGLIDSGGTGVMLGIREQSTDIRTQGTTAAASTVGAVAGNVNITAGQAYRQVGSDITAPGGNITITAQKVDIIEARETSRSDTEQKFRQSGLTLEVTSPVISAVQTMQQMDEVAANTSNDRMKALAAANVALAARNAYNAVRAGQGTTMNGKDGQIATGGNNPMAHPPAATPPMPTRWAASTLPPASAVHRTRATAPVKATPRAAAMSMPATTSTSLPQV